MGASTTLLTFGSIVNDSTATADLNQNFAAVNTALGTCLSTQGQAPNQMQANLDMNSNQILNLPSPGTMNSPARLVDVVTNPTVVVPPTGTSGGTVPFLNGNNTWSGTNTFSTIVGPTMPAVRMYPPSTLISTVNSTTPWLVFDPYGNAVSIPSTTTSGLQEAINFAVSHGYPLEVYGHGAFTVETSTASLNNSNIITNIVGGTSNLLVGDWVTVINNSGGVGLPQFTQISSIDSSSQIHINKTASITQSLVPIKFARNVVYISCTSGIQVPPTEQWSCTFKNVNITFGTNVNGPGFTFDSALISNFEFIGGQIVYQPASPGGTSFALYFNPANPVPEDGFAAISASKFFFSNVGSIASGGTAVAVVGCNLSLGGITNNHFGSVELNGTNTTQNGFYIFGSTANTAFTQNTMDFANVHLCTNAGIAEGVTTTNAGGLNGNVWRIGGLRSTSNGFITYGSNDLIDIGSINNAEGGTVAQGVAFQTSAIQNQGRFGTITATTPVVNQPGNKNIYTTGGDIFKDGTAYTNP